MPTKSDSYDSISFPVYDGSYDPSVWIKNANGYFSFHHTPIGHRVDTASFHLQGRALDWFWSLLASRSSVSWSDFVEELHSYFGSTTLATIDDIGFKSSSLQAAATVETVDFFGAGVQNRRDPQTSIDAAFAPLFKWISTMKTHTQQCTNLVPAFSLETSPNSTVGSQVSDVYGQDWAKEESFVIPGSATVASPVSILATSAEKGGDAHKEPGVHLGDFSRVLPGLYSPTGCFSHGEIKIQSNSVIGSQSRILPGAAVEENVIFGALSVAPSDAALQRDSVYLGSPTPAMVKNTLHVSDERIEDMEPEYRKIVGNLTANLAATTKKVKSSYFLRMGAEDDLRESDLYRRNSLDDQMASDMKHVIPLRPSPKPPPATACLPSVRGNAHRSSLKNSDKCTDLEDKIPKGCPLVSLLSMGKMLLARAIHEIDAVDHLLTEMDGIVVHNGVFMLEAINRPPGKGVCAISCAMFQASISRSFPVMSKPPPKPHPPLRPPPKPPWVLPRQALVKISRSMSHVG